MQNVTFPPPQPSASPPGWYEAPGAPGILRYWDGSCWTEYTKSRPRDYLAAAEDGVSPNRYQGRAFADASANLATPEGPRGRKPKKVRQRAKLSSYALGTLLVSMLIVGIELTVFGARDAYKSAFDVPTPTAAEGEFGQDAVVVPESAPETTLQGTTGREAYHEELDVLAASIEDFWQVSYKAQFRAALAPLKGSVTAWSGGPLPAALRDCGVTGRLITGNAAYVPCADGIVYDNTELFPGLDKKYGPLALGVVLAHEWGHAIQARAGMSGVPSIVAENQADCFAGAWLSSFRASENWGPGAEEVLPWTLTVTAELSDPAGYSKSTDEDAHGSMFDRVGAILDGMTGGVPKCVAYLEAPPESIMLQWNEGLQDDGELTDEELVRMSELSVEEYWRQRSGGKNVPDISRVEVAGGDCPMPEGAYLYSYCQASGSLVSGESSWAPPVDSPGDTTRLLALELPFLDGYKAVTGSTSHRACLAGEWFRFEYEGRDPVFSLSPPDVDEAAWAMIIADWVEARHTGTFQPMHLAEFRRGVLSGCGEAFTQPVLTTTVSTG